MHRSALEERLGTEPSVDLVRQVVEVSIG
jgi:hypothetical protein